ncbi:MAG: serine/threonine-protein phosphatase [Kiritimatiellae bacterium]|nr:serine/threonine-protein phosphatase [Kiritimatiellia bacterium]
MIDASDIVCAVRTNVGLVRETNEDAYGVLSEDGVYFVSDGMGGGEAGEVASQIVKSRLEGMLSGSAENSPGLRLFDSLKAIDRANDEIVAYAAERGYRQMGATVALLVVDAWNPVRAVVVHAGDSRIYRLRSRKLKAQTVDHTLRMDLLRKSDNHYVDIKEEYAHLLTRAIGTSRLVQPEVKEIDIALGDRMLVCSDGVWNMLDDETIAGILNSHADVETAADALSESVLAAGAKDNFTFIIVDVVKKGRETPVVDSERIESEHLKKLCMKGAL